MKNVILVLFIGMIGYSSAASIVRLHDWTIKDEGIYLYSKKIDFRTINNQAENPFSIPPATGPHKRSKSTNIDEIDIDEIEERYVNWLVGENVDYNKPEIDTRYRFFLSAGEGAKDISSYDLNNTSLPWDLSTSEDSSELKSISNNHLIRLSFLYNLKGSNLDPNTDYLSETLKEKILNLFAYIKAKGLSSTTNFKNKGLYLRCSGYATAVFLMKEELKQAGELVYHLSVINQLTNEITPENLDISNPGVNSDAARVTTQQRLCYILSLDNPIERTQNMEALRLYMNNALQIANGWTDNIKPDYITYHHRGAYSNAYGTGSLHTCSIINLMLKDTQYELSDSARDNLKKALKNFIKLSIDFELPRTLGGRFPYFTTTLSLLRPAFAYLYLSDKVSNLDMGQEFKRMYEISTVDNDRMIKSTGVSIEMLNSLGGMQNMIDVLDDNLSSPNRIVGHFGYPYAGISIHKPTSQKYMVSQKGHNKHIWHFESSSHENVYGRYNSAGAMEIFTLGTPITRSANGLTNEGWDWSHIPGTTVPYLSTSNLKILTTAESRKFTSKDFLVNSTFDNYGVFAMDYEGSNPATNVMSEAKISSYFFEDKILCIGSNIKGDGQNPIHTTLFQTSLSDISTPSYINGDVVTGNDTHFNSQDESFWATDALGNGFVVPENPYNNGSIHLKRNMQLSRDHSDSNDTSDNFVTSYIDHSVNPENTSYQYSILLQGGEAGTEEYANNFSDWFEVLQQNNKAHITKYVKDSIYNYVIFDATNVFSDDLIITVNKPSVITTQKIENEDQLKLSIANPNLGLLEPGEFYDWSGLNQDLSILYKVPTYDQITLLIEGKWSLSDGMSNVFTKIIDNNTELKFNTINGATIQIDLFKYGTPNYSPLLYTNILDSNFEQALIDLGYDDTLDESVPTNNINDIISLDLSGKQIANLTGIQDFVALSDLNISNNNLTSLDLSSNTALSNLNLSNNNLTGIDISSNTTLTNLNLSNNNLTSLDLSSNTALTTLNLASNNLINLNLNLNHNLTTLLCGANSLVSLTLKNGAKEKIISFDAILNPGLTCIEVDDVVYSTNNWTNIDAGTNFNTDCNMFWNTNIPDVNFEQTLINLNIDNLLDGSVLTSNITSITTIDLSGKQITDLTGIQDFVALTYLDISDNNLLDLDISSNTALTDLNLSNNNLTSLGVSSNTALTDLNLYKNNLTNLDINSNTALTYLNLSNNSLTSLDISSNTALTYLNLYKNSLTGLDVSSNTTLTDLNVNETGLTSLDVTSNTALKRLYCKKNNLTSLNLSSNTALTTLVNSESGLTSLDLSLNTSLSYLNCSGNNLTSMNIKNGANDKITTFDTTLNPSLTCIEVDNEVFSTNNWTNIDIGANFSTDCSSSLELEPLNKKSINISPNPTMNIVHIKNKENNDLITITNLNGLEHLRTTKNEIDLSNLSSGIYIIKIISELKVTTEKIIKL